MCSPQAIVQMSVEYAQQTELARINKLSCQASTGMQTQSSGEETAEEDAAVSVGAWLKEERERLEKELRDRDTEIRKLREKLRRAELGTGEKASVACVLPSPVNHQMQTH